MVSEAYRGDIFDLAGTGYQRCLDVLVPCLPPLSRILDLGCGCGVPIAKTLSARFHVTGLDISEVQINRARELVPAAEFVCADMSEHEFPCQSFEAIVSFYALIHVPLVEQRQLLKKLTHWLADSGHLLMTVGHQAWTGCEENWRGVDGATMYWSQADRGTYRQWIEGLGYRLIDDIFIPEGSSGHNTLVAQKD